MLKEFKSYRNRLTSTLRAARNPNFLKVFWNVAQQCSDIVWQKVNTLLHPNNRAVVPDIIEYNGERVGDVALANAFNRFFIEQSDNSSHHEIVSSFKKYLPAKHSPTHCFLPKLPA